MSVRREIQNAVRALPPGGIVGYGDVARVCGTIPLLVGKALAFCDADVPWQRVIGADGTLRTARRGSIYAARQRALLEAEGVLFTEQDRVPPDEPAWERGRAALAAWAMDTEGYGARPDERGGISGGQGPPPRERPPSGRDRRGAHNGVKHE